MIADDERLGLPSASGAYTRHRCRRQTSFIDELRAQGKVLERKAGPDAESGTRSHMVWANLAPESTLSDSERDTVAELRRLEKLVLTDWAGNDSFSVLGREVRLWLHRGITPIFSGQYDCAYVSLDQKRILLLDAKTLYGTVQPAALNEQLRELVALLFANYPQTEEFTLAILQPNVAERMSLAFYDRFEATLALRELIHHLADIRAPEHARIPGSYCQYCPALPHCPEALALAKLETIPLLKAYASALPTLPIGERGSAVLASLLAAKPLIERFLSLYKELLAQNSDAIPGWRLKPGKRSRELFEPLAIWTLAQQAGISLEQFLEVTKISVTGLQKALGETQNLKGAALKEAFERIFSAQIQWHTHAPELDHER